MGSPVSKQKVPQHRQNEYLVDGYIRIVNQSLNNNVIIPRSINLICFQYYYHSLIKKDDFQCQHYPFCQQFEKIRDIVYRKNHVVILTKEKVYIWKVIEGGKPIKIFVVKLNVIWPITVDINHDLSLICIGGLGQILTVYHINNLYGFFEAENANYIEIHYFSNNNSKTQREQYDLCLNHTMFMDKLPILINKNNTLMASKYILACCDVRCAAFDIDEYKEPYKLWTISDVDCNECDYFVYDKQKILVMFCCDDGYLYLADFMNSTINNEKYYAKINVTSSNINTCSFSPNGRFIATGSQSGYINIYDINNLNWNKHIDVTYSSFLNGIQSIHQCKIPEKYYMDIGRIRWLNNKCLIVCIWDDQCNDVYYIKNLENKTSDNWVYGAIKTKHTQMITSISLNNDRSVLFTASDDKRFTAHYIRQLHK